MEHLKSIEAGHKNGATNGVAPVVKNTPNVWQQRGETYWPGTTSQNTKKIPPGIYRFDITPQGAWYLERSAERYTFPYKIYGVHGHIVDRIQRAWRGLDSSFGVLLNGLKGTGKTITAQQIVNWAIDEGLPVLNVTSPLPVPLATLMEKVEQPLLVLFDEFEKTHNEDETRGVQQQLLSAIDGLSRNEHRRLFLFTTNTKAVNDNFIDRPSRIRYSWEFGRLDDALIASLLNDLLDPKLSHLRPEILSYLSMRKVLTIDVVKTTIMECNVFQQGPAEFKDFMNLSEKEPNGFKLDIVEDSGAVEELSSYYMVQAHGPYLLSMMSKSGQEAFTEAYCARGRSLTFASSSGQCVDVLGPTDKEDEWICKVQIAAYRTWVGPKLEKSARKFLWLDAQPAGWRMPEWARKIESGEVLTDAEHEAFETWTDSESVYGNTKGVRKVRVRFTQNMTPYTFRYDGVDR